MPKFKYIAAIIIFGLFFFTSAFGRSENSIQTCYGGKVAARDQAPNVELFLAIDQTTLFNASLKQLVADNVRSALVAGNAFSVIQFSAFTQGHYTDVLTSGMLEKTIPKEVRDDISKPALSAFDKCMTGQPLLAAQYVGDAMRRAFGGANSDIAKSDILASLKDISGKIKLSKAERKVLFISSDMLENSSISVFYSKKNVRLIDPEKEMKLVETNHLLGDFGGASVYVVGAGLLPEDATGVGGYRPPQVIQALQVFWKKYFERSNAKLIEFGTPALLNAIKF